MSEQSDALTFGPQWIRDLSNGANVCVPPPSPGPTYKLAQFRYGKEEMLALFATQSIVTPPVINSEIGEYILTKDIRQPLSYLPMSEEEQRNQFGSLNSAAVLKILGRGGRGGGRGSTGSTRGGRGSGRGRGEAGFHRGFSVDETTSKGEDGWQPTTSRRLSWGEIGRGGFPDRGTREVEPSPRGFELSAPPNGRHKEASRALSSGNWRSSESGEADDDGGGWTVSGPRGSERADKWRGSARGGRHNSAEDYNMGGEHGSGERWNDNWNRGSRDRNSFDDLPEWSKSDNVFEPDLGSFDSTGAFCVVKDKKKFDDTGQRESIDDKEQKEDWEKELSEDTHGTPVSDSKIDFNDHNKDLTKEDSPDKTGKLEELQENKTEIQQQANAVRENKLTTHPKENKSNSAPVREEKAAGIKPKHTASEASQAEGRNTSVVDSHDKVGADLERVAESCIANLVVECENVPETQARPSSVETPRGDSDGDKLRSSPDDKTRWFYRDPQGQEQGPFSSEEMVEWFHHGYFTMQLSIRRECDIMYLALGEVIKRWQRVPFLPGPAPPPITHQHLVDQQTMFMRQRLLQQHYDDLQKQAILQQIQQQQQQQQQQTTHAVSPSGAAELIWGPEPSSPKISWSPVSNTTGDWDQSTKQKSPVPSAEDVRRLEEEKAKAEAEKREAELMALKRKEEEKRQMLKKKEEEERLQREAVQRENELRLKKQKEEEEEEEEEMSREKERRRQEIQQHVEAEKRKETAKQKKKAQQEQKQRKESEEQKQKQNGIRDQQKQALMRLQQQQQELQRREQQIQEKERAVQKKLERQIQEEENAQQLQQHLQQKRMQQSNSASKWGRQSPPTLSLSAIQEQEEKNRRAHQERMKELEARQRELQSVATAGHGWADNQSNPSSVKSLKAIQDEQSRQPRSQKNKPAPRTQPAPVSSSGAWANSWTAGNNNVWSGVDLADEEEQGEKDTGFWAEAGRAVSAKSPSQPQREQTRVCTTQSVANEKKSGKKATKEEESVRRLFQLSGDNDPFMEWCSQSLYGIHTSVDIPTFIAFLKEVESPYEIHSYVNDFLGDSNQAKTFAKEFIQKKAALCAAEKRTASAKPAPTAADVVPRGGGGANRTLHENEAELKDNSAGNVKNKKKKKQRMQKVDPSILGFSVNAAAERVNMGEIQSVDDS